MPKHRGDESDGLKVRLERLLQEIQANRITDGEGGAEIVDTTETWRLVDELLHPRNAHKRNSSAFYAAKCMKLSEERRDPSKFGGCLRYFPIHAIKYLCRATGTRFSTLKRNSNPRYRYDDTRTFFEWVRRIHLALEGDGKLNHTTPVYYTPDQATRGALTRLTVTNPHAAQLIKKQLRAVEREFEAFRQGHDSQYLFNVMWELAVIIQDVAHAFRALQISQAQTTAMAEPPSALPAGRHAALQIKFPNPSVPMSKKEAADAWGGGMTVPKLTSLMDSRRIQFLQLNRQTFVFCRDEIPQLPER